MTTDGVNIAEDAEMAECDGDKVVTMMDVLQEQQDFEEDANAVLGASDDKNCTYSKGYIKRQALYACLTCCTEAKVDPTKRAGVCLACSLNCHENHELIELYTKRNFRCDCGNPKFNSHPCQFTTDKTELNDDNIYNQNFSGLYCTCQRPYPDPESTIEEDMIQCIICEDWLHASHLEAVVPASDQYSEMVCKNCMEKNEFLHDYSMFAVTVELGDVDIVTVNGDAKSANNSLCNGDSEKEKLVNGIVENNTEIETTSVTVNGDVEMNEEKENSSEKKVDESVAAETNNVTKSDEVSTTVDSIELKPEDTESKIAEQGEQALETMETNESAKHEAPADPEDSNNDKEQEETSEDTLEKSDAIENITIDDPTQNGDTPPESAESTNKNPEKAESTDEKMESTDNKPEEADEKIKEQTETPEQISKQAKSEEDGDGDKAQKNETETSEKTEQQLLDDLTALTADNPTSEEKAVSAAEEKTESAEEEKTESATEEKTESTAEETLETATVEKATVENMEQSEDGKEKHEGETKNIKIKEASTEEHVKESGEKSEEKPVVENKTVTGNIEVPDTSQSEKDANENSKEKTDSVMDAIDELLQTAHEAKEKEYAEESKEPTSESTESMEATDNIEKKESDVEMSASENKLDNEVPEREKDTADSNDKPSTNTEDVEMSDTSTQNEPISESKVDEDPTNISGNKDANDTEATKVNEVKLENESVEEKPLSSDTTNDSELKSSDDNDSTIEMEPSKDTNEVPTVTENAKEHKRKLSTDLTDDMSSKKAKLDCVRPKDVNRVHKGATFWPSNFRHKLCTCGECLSMYKDLKVLFLTDLEDTVFAYESLGKENVAGGVSQYEKGMQALSSLGRIQQINALTEYNRMRDKLLDFLKSFKDRKEVVKEEDIKAFFAGMKPRREPDGVYFCR